MADSDSDVYMDIAEVAEEEDVEMSEEPANNNNGRARGPDIDWVEVATFSNTELFKESEYFKDTKELLTMRRARESYYHEEFDGCKCFSRG